MPSAAGVNASVIGGAVIAPTLALNVGATAVALPLNCNVTAVVGDVMVAGENENAFGSDAVGVIAVS